MKKQNKTNYITKIARLFFILFIYKVKQFKGGVQKQYNNENG